MTHLNCLTSKNTKQLLLSTAYIMQRDTFFISYYKLNILDLEVADQNK